MPDRMRLLLFTLCTLLLAPTILTAQPGSGSRVSYAKPAKYTIAGITVVGMKTGDVQAIKLFAGLKEGDEVEIPGDRIAAAVKNLWDQDLFADVEIYAAEFRGSDVYLVIKIEEMPRIGGHIFDGISKSEESGLDEKVSVRTGVVANENLKRTTTNAIKTHFADKGYYNTTVEIREKPDPILVPGVFWTIVVDKGPRVKVEEINITGAEKLSEKRILHSMKNTKKRAFHHIFKSSKFIEDDYSKDLESIIARYNKEGYRNAKILSDSVYSLSPGRLAVDIHLTEGGQFRYRDIRFVGNTKYRTGQLDSILNLSSGDIYNVELLNQRLYGSPTGRDLATLYGDDGYLTFYAFPVETLVPGDSIDVEIRLVEGEQYRIGQVGISGNTKTNDHVLFREIRTKPGDLFSRTDVIRTQREFAALGYFNPEAFDIRMDQHPENGTVDLVYVVEEKPSDQIELSGGWGGGRIVGSLGLSFTNFSMRNIFTKGAWSPLPTGDGQRLSLRAVSNGLYYQSYLFSFTEPWMGGKKPNSLSISLNKSVQTNGERKRVDGEFNPSRQSLSVTGASVFLGKRLQKPDDWFTLLGGVSYQYFDLNNFNTFFSFSNGFSNNIAANFTIERNSVSDPIYPTWGSKVTLSGKFTPPYSTLGEAFGKDYDYENMSDQERFHLVEYHKWKFTVNWYTAINKHKTHKLVLASNMGFGFLGSYNNNIGLAPFERFYLGGVFLSGFLLDGREIVNLRGYDDLSLTEPSSRVGAPVIAKYGTELRFPISTNPNASVYALTFVEAGKTWENFRQFNPFQVYRSAGLGLRIFLPMFGMLGFDYGWRLDDVPSAPRMARGQFHFSIGMQMGEL